MRAQTVYKKAFVFDFDECVAITDAKIHVYRNGVHVKALNSKEYNFYEKHPKDKLNFSEFNNGELILAAKKYKMWPVIRNISNAIKTDRSTSEIYILTGRNSVVKSYIYEFLKRHGIEIDIDNIITVGDNIGKVSISEEKRKKLTELVNTYDKVFFFDDDPKNIALANSIKGVKTRLVENYVK